jgi:hypothetical protein
MNANFWEEMDDRMTKTNDGFVIRSMLLESFPALTVFTSVGLCEMCKLKDTEWLERSEAVRRGLRSAILSAQAKNKTRSVSQVMCEWFGTKYTDLWIVSDDKLYQHPV